MNFTDYLASQTVPFEDSALGRVSSKMDGQIEGLRRIADAAEQRAKLAEQEAEIAKSDAKFSKLMSVLALLISFGSFLVAVISLFVQ